MRRVLCVRFPNWPLQRACQALREQNEPVPELLALHTPGRAPTSASARTSRERDRAGVDEDEQYLRQLFPAAVTGPVVVSVSPAAAGRGLRPGMPLAEARSLAAPLARRSTSTAARSVSGRQVARNPSPRNSGTQATPSVTFLEWTAADDRRQLISVAELNRVCAPIVALDDAPLPDCLLLDITGCGPLFGGESALAEFLLRTLKQAGWHARIAVADTVAAAWALVHVDRIPATTRTNGGGTSVRTLNSSRRGSSDRLQNTQNELPVLIVAPGQHRSELAPLPVAAARLPLKDLEILSHLGIRTIGRLLSLPPEDLPSRFSSAAVLRVQQIADRVEESLVPLREADPVRAEWSSEQPLTSHADAQFVLQRLTEDIAVRLEQRRLSCSAVEVTFRHATAGDIRLSAGVVRPTQSAALLHEVLCLRLDAERQAAIRDVALNKDEHRSSPVLLTALLDGSVLSARAVATAAPLPVSRQKDLFSPDEHIRPQDELAALAARLTGRLGADAVLTAELKPDARPGHDIAFRPLLPERGAAAITARSEQVLQLLTEASAASPAGPLCGNSAVLNHRPLRLFVEPQRMEASDTRAGRPVEVILDGRTLTLHEFSAPERLQTGWWTDHNVQRDYFRVTTSEGSQLWLFQDLIDKGWYLHGVFD